MFQLPGELLHAEVDFLNSIVGYDGGNSIWDRDQLFADLVESYGRYLKVEPVYFPHSNRLIRGCFGGHGCVVTLEDTEDPGPKIHRFFNVRPHGDELQVDHEVRLRILHGVFNPETLKGQSLTFYFDPGDAAKFYENDPDNALWGGGPRVTLSGHRAIMLPLQSGWGSSNYGPSFAGFMATAIRLSRRIRKERGFLATYKAGHCAVRGENAYLQLAVLAAGRSIDVDATIDYGRFMEEQLSKLGVRWSPYMFDAPDLQPLMGTRATFLTHGASGASGGIVSDGDIVAQLFSPSVNGQQPVMLTFESPVTKMVPRPLSEISRLRLQYALRRSQRQMGAVFHDAARLAETDTSKDPYREQLVWMDNLAGDLIEISNTHDTDDQAAALMRAAVNAYWKQRNLYSALPYLLDETNVCLDRRAAKQEIYRNAVRTIDKFEALTNEAFSMNELPLQSQIVGQAAASYLAYGYALGQHHEAMFDGLDQRVVNAMHQAYSDDCTPFLPTRMSSLGDSR